MTTEKDRRHRTTSPAGKDGSEGPRDPSVPGLVLLGRMGSGGAGDVHEAVESATGRHVAVKFLRTGGAAEGSLRARLEREVQVAALLHHQNVVTIYYSGWSEGVPYIVMELVRGMTLMEHVRSRGLSRRERLQLFVAACDGVQHAHGRHVVHRDLKPDNVMVDEAGNVKVLDFGIAVLAEGPRLTTEGDFVGTLSHAAPEQLLGEPVDERTDVHGLGLILHELITDRPARAGLESIAELTRAILSHRPTRPSSIVPGVPPDIDAIVAKATAPEPEARYPSVAELRDDAVRHLAGRPVRARPAGPARQVMMWARRHPIVTAATLGTTTIIIALAGLAVIAARDARRERDRAVETALRAIEVLQSMTPPGVASAGEEARLEPVYRVATRLGAGDVPPSEVDLRLLRDLADMHAAAGLWDRAVSMRTTAVELQSGRGSMSDAMASDLEALARARLGQQRPDLALPVAQQAWDRLAATRSPEALLARATLARALAATGRIEDARRHAAEVEAAMEMLSGLRPGLDLETAISLAEIRADDPAIAGGILRQVLSRTRVQPWDSRRAAALEALGRTLLQLGRPDEADGPLRESVGLRHLMYGLDSPVVASALSLLAESCSARGYHEEAMLHAEAAHRLAAGHFGPEDDRALEAMDTLATLRERAGESRAAEALRATVLRHRQHRAALIGVPVDGPLQHGAAVARRAVPPAAALGVTVRSVGPLQRPRLGHSLTLLPDGTALVCGGTSVTQGMARADCEVFDPKDSRFRDGGRMRLPRSGHFAVMLQDGSILVGGGTVSGFSWPNMRAEVRDPSSGDFRIVGEMGTPRSRHASALLADDGRVIVVGGASDGEFGAATDSIEAYDPATGRFEPLGRLTLSRTDFATCVLPDERLVVIGGLGWFAGEATNTIRERTEEMLPSDGSESALEVLPAGRRVASSESCRHGDACLVAFDDGEVRLRRGDGWSEAIGVVDVGSGAAAFSLGPRHVLIIGDVRSVAFEPATGAWQDLPEIPGSLQAFAAVELPDGCVLVTGGGRGGEALAAGGAWLVCPPMSE